MRRTGVADLPLHGGSAPYWLVSRMKRLARALSDVIIAEFGQKELVARLANPDWFQAFSCVLAFDWHSSGTTTVVCGVLKSVIDPETHGLAVVGGKGAASRRAPSEIRSLQDTFSLPSRLVDSLERASRLSAKVDSALLQDGFDLYHHSMFITERGEWAVVQQGMDPGSRMARRYHWLSEGVRSFVEEPHSGIASEVTREHALDLTAKASRPCRDRSLEVALQGRDALLDDLAKLPLGPQKTLVGWTQGEAVARKVLPARINWEAMNRVYDFEPRNYEDFVLVKGVGKSTVRALALISDLVYGDPPSWKDPVKYTYAFGGKDGVPYPVDRQSYDEGIEVLDNAIKEAKIGQTERIAALRRLRSILPEERRVSGRL